MSFKRRANKFLRNFQTKFNGWNGSITPLEVLSFRSAIYIDNQFPDAFEQVVHYFENGLLDRSQTVVLFRHYATSAKQTIALCRQYGLKFYCFRQYGDSPKLKNAHVFYPFNSQSNCRLALNRTCKHVLLLHGESNKTASVPPLNRMYDYILVAGNIACDRLVESEILRQEDIDGGRVIRFGDMMVQRFEEVIAAKDDHSELAPAILYAPTWEGGVVDENFSSLENGFGAQAVTKLCKALNISTVVVKFHPNTGHRDTQYLKFVSVCLDIFVKYGLKIYFIAEKHQYIYQSVLKPIEKRGVVSALKNTPYPIRAGLCDVSGVDAIFDVMKIDNLVIVKNKEKMKAPKSYFEKKKNAIVVFGGIDVISADNVAHLSRVKSRANIAQLISWQTEVLRTASAEERREWLQNYLRDDPFWNSPIH